MRESASRHTVKGYPLRFTPDALAGVTIAVVGVFSFAEPKLIFPSLFGNAGLRLSISNVQHLWFNICCFILHAGHISGTSVAVVIDNTPWFYQVTAPAFDSNTITYDDAALAVIQG